MNLYFVRIAKFESKHENIQLIKIIERRVVFTYTLTMIRQKMHDRIRYIVPAQC